MGSSDVIDVDKVSGSEATERSHADSGVLRCT